MQQTRAGEQGRLSASRRAAIPARVSGRALVETPRGSASFFDVPGVGPVELVRSRRKTLSLEVKPPARVIVRAPMRASLRSIQAFVEAHREWIADAVERVQARHDARAEAAERAGMLSEADLATLARQARSVIPARVAHFAPLVGITYGRITLRCQKTRWGSCSAAGNLNFNVLLMLAPPEVLDYVVVHELCHRLEMNHSPRFWALVAQHDPEHRAHRAWLKQHGPTLLARAGKLS